MAVDSFRFNEFFCCLAILCPLYGFLKQCFQYIPSWINVLRNTFWAFLATEIPFVNVFWCQQLTWSWLKYVIWWCKKQTTLASLPLLISRPQTTTLCILSLSLSLPLCLVINKVILFTRCHMQKTRSLCFIAKRLLRNVTTGLSVQSHQGLGCVFVFKLCQEAFNQS